MESYTLTPASVQRNEFIGTAAAETDITTHATDVYTLIGLDRERWGILAIELRTGTGGPNSEVGVYAINREENGLLGLSHEKLLALAEERGDLPVTHFQVHGVKAADIAGRVFKRYTVQLRTRSIGDVDLRVTDRGDLLD